MSTQMTNKVQIKISEIKELLKKGYVRYKKDNQGQGSIEEHYNLSAAQVKQIFLTPKLKGLKTRVQKSASWEIIDDEPATVEVVNA